VSRDHISPYNVTTSSSLQFISFSNRVFFERTGKSLSPLPHGGRGDPLGRAREGARASAHPELRVTLQGQGKGRCRNK